MENKLINRTTLFFLLFSILLILQFQHVTSDEGGQNVAQDYPGKPLFSKILMDTVSLLRKSHESSWEKIKTVIHDLQMQFSPPTLDFRGAGNAEHDGMKEAVGKSFDKSKESVKETAKTAAELVGDAIHKTTEKVKDSSETDKESKAEL
ncbi:uncharacterized protein LOC123913989 [Trifolium pratense]|uniref:uncharacterized protein LOC123913989 n=1 Tax=Trifolium pratense TaxID=57577 RepID=UPI001E697C9A|nr:uncharacterized protein LOC123913989 [Trifolium pratense]